MSRSDRASSVLHAKIVYYGPEQSGKTAMLQSLHRRLDPDGHVRLYSVDSGDERTLFFDLLSVQELELGPYRVRTRLFSTPGRERYQAVRRCVLAHADAIVFVADAQKHRLDDNRASLLDLERNLDANGIDATRVPLVIAANKSDLDDALSGEHLRAVLLERECPVIETCAPQGQGVVDVFTKALRKMLGIAAVRTDDESAKAALLPSKDLLRHLLQPGEPGRATPDEIARRRIVISVPPPEPAMQVGSDCLRCDELAAGAVMAQTRLADLYDEIEASHRQLEGRNRELLAVNRVSRSILSAMDTDNLLVVLLDVVTRHLEASHASFVIFDPSTREGLRTHVQGFGKDPLLELPVEGARAFFDLIRNSDAPVAFNERDNVPLFQQLRRIDGRIHRAICAAVKTRGKPTGWLAVYQFADEQPLDTHSLLLLSSLSGLASLGLEKISLLDEVQRFNQRLEEEVQSRTSELEMANAKIRALNRGLESRVVERTRELASANRALKEAQAEALHATRLRAMGGLAGHFAHEINNPVASLVSNLVFMKETLDGLRTRVAVTGPEAAEALHALDEFEQVLEESTASAGRVARIIDGLKRFGDEEKPSKSVSLNAAVADTVTLLEDRLQACAELELRLGDIPELGGDALEVHHLVLALVTNAVESMERAGRRGVLRVATYASGGKVTLVVEDTGVGIDEELLDKLFEPFSSTKEGEPGTGLGLHAAHQAVQRRGGRIGVRSRPGEGAAFTVVLPVAAAAREERDPVEASS